MTRQKKILIASANPWSFSVAVEQEVARLNASEARVDMLDLFGICSRHSPHWRRRDVIVERLNRKIQRFVVPAVNGREITSEIRLDRHAVPAVPERLEGLRAHSVGDARVGLAVLSSVTSLTTIQQPRGAAEYGEVFPAAWLSAHLSAQAGEAVKAIGYDEIYIFNGRLCYSRPFCDVLEPSARVFRYEQGATGSSYVMADRSIQHPATTHDLVMAHDYDPAAGEAFYRDRLNKAAGDPVNFYTAAQIEGLIPGGVSAGGFVAFFNSSSDELIAISDDLGLGHFPSQAAAAEAIARAAAAHGKGLVLRLHPHLQYKHESWRREWDFDRLRALGVTILAPEDPYDSYALAAAAHCVFTCGSTVGLECSFRGIPNADVGLWVGARLGAMRHVMDEVDVSGFVREPSLPPRAKEMAMRYGSFVRRAGTPLPRLDVGRHPYYARLGGEIVDPVRYALQCVRDAIAGRRRRMPIGSSWGKVMIDPTIEQRAGEKLKGAA